VLVADIAILAEARGCGMRIMIVLLYPFRECRLPDEQVRVNWYARERVYRTSRYGSTDAPHESMH